MNKKGFTLVEVIVVIVLLGLVITLTTTSIMGASNNAKEKMLQTKIENIEKAAVLYGQDKRNKINVKIEESQISYDLCFKKLDDDSLKHIKNCYYYSENGTDVATITVGFLANPDGDSTTSDGYINYDEGEDIVNPVDEDMTLNDCQIQIYQKYGKIYAHYTKQKKDGAQENTKCWVD